MSDLEQAAMEARTTHEEHGHAMKERADAISALRAAEDAGEARCKAAAAATRARMVLYRVAVEGKSIAEARSAEAPPA